ncbi:MAG: phosphoribosyltransferase family protein [Weeksellaceae bacterium]
MVFKDRVEAAYLLADDLKQYKNQEALVLAIPRGGIPLGYVVAKELNLPLEVVLSKKIGHPNQKEFAIGAVTLRSRILSPSILDVSSKYIEDETQAIRAFLAKRYQEYYGKKKPPELNNKIVIVIDDGIATGNTILSTLEMLHNEKPNRIVVAVPVSSKEALKKLQKSSFIDEVVCLLTPTNFQAVGQFYENFDSVENAEVKNLLNQKTVD